MRSDARKRLDESIDRLEAATQRHPAGSGDLTEALAAVSARLDAATVEDSGWEPYPLRLGGVMVECEGTDADADLIAHAPNDLRMLLAEVKRLRTEVAEEQAAKWQEGHESICEDVDYWCERLHPNPYREGHHTDTQRLTQAALARVAALCDGPTGNGYKPYAVALPDGIHLAVLLDDLRAAIEADDA